MVQWIGSHEAILTWLTVASTVTFVACLIGVPFLIVRIPSDYFAHGRDSRKHWADQHLAAKGMLMIAKNLLGYILVVAGIFMLVLPGQGVLTILVGIMLLNFPGKYKLERWIVARQPVLRSINWIRRRAGKPPLVLEG
jgi:hypothetical protein